MKNCLKKLKNRKGFTLIELLVVIGILGILAAALIATIDPFEQLKKADDSKVKNLVVEFQNANVRYYATHTSFPWNQADSTNDTCTGLGATGIAGLDLSNAALTACLGTPTTTSSLIGEGELKQGFTSNVGDLEKVFVTWSADPDPNTLIVCFQPTSRSQRGSLETIYNISGVAQSSDTCPKQDNTCYWCTR